MPHVDLLELPYFDGISLDDMVGLVDLMEPCRFQPKETIVEEGALGPTPLYIATSGNVVISKHSGNEECVLAELDSPTLFGEIELFCQLPAVATIRASTRVECFTLTRATFESLFEQGHPALMRFIYNVARVACHRLAIADEIMAQLVGDKDLVKIRQAVFMSMATRGSLGSTTGAFRRPPR